MAAHSDESMASVFMAEVVSQVPGDSRLQLCIQCGSCGGSCPAGTDMDRTPRGVFALIAEDRRAEALASNTMWFCVSCYRCSSRCPQEIHIPDLMYALKRIAQEEKVPRPSPSPEASGFAGTFADLVEKYGRSFELGLVTLHHLRMHPLETARLAPFGFGMLRKGRLAMAPQKIRGIRQLRAILARAKEIEAAA